MRQTLVIMVKEPRPGRVKTRLARDIGAISATWWFRHQVKTLLRNVTDRRWQVVLAVSPDRAGVLSRVWPAHIARIPQGSGDLGDRMGRVFRTLPGRVCIIGADIPGINRQHINSAFRALRRDTAVFGPAPDGGFWLIGLRHPRAGVFQGVRWSTQHARRDTKKSLPDHEGVEIATLRDVDTVHDLAVTLRKERDTAGL